MSGTIESKALLFLDLLYTACAQHVMFTLTLYAFPQLLCHVVMDFA